MDVVDQFGRGAVGAPEFVTVRVVVGLEVEVVPEGGEALRAGAVASHLDIEYAARGRAVCAPKFGV